jgi:NitT/TauT family transport system ATP-binding protein
MRWPVTADPRVLRAGPDPGGHDAAHVVIDAVGKTFRRAGRRTVALAEVSLDIAAGELVCLLGPSGCGKSTLLRIAAGALASDEGSVSVGGRLVTGPSHERGMLFQTPMLFGWLTTKNNVLFGPRAQRAAGIHQRDDPELDVEADSILRTVGLAEFSDAFPHELSGGMRHRAAFARAVATRPSLLLMDEPFGALDALTRARMHEFLLSMWDQYEITIIFVTHDIEEAVLLGDRVAVMGGHPPGISQVIPVPLGRPRHADDVDTEPFIAVKRQIRAALAGPPTPAADAVPRGIRRRP